jgi:8-oxo-dGTP pyrophosphatase MutT (NUDIX family)
MLLDLGQVEALLQARNASVPANEGSSTAPGTEDSSSGGAAVAIIFRTGENQSEVLVIERAQQLGDPWSGHLAFPGGRHETNDPDPLFTAIRETREELGLDLQRHGRLLGALEPVSTRGTGLPNLTIAPFAFSLGASSELRVDPAEVASVFWVPLGPLLRGERDTILELEPQSARHRMPAFDVEGRVLWGLSYRMLQSFFALLHDR